MSDYYFTFFFHMKEQTRPEGFPRIVRIRHHISGITDDTMLMTIYNKMVSGFCEAPGISAYLDDMEIDISKIQFDKKVFIPWHQIAYMHGRSDLLTIQRPPTMSLAEGFEQAAAKAKPN